MDRSAWSLSVFIPPLLTCLKVMEYLAGGSCLDLVSGVMARGLARQSGTRLSARVQFQRFAYAVPLLRLDNSLASAAISNSAQCGQHGYHRSHQGKQMHLDLDFLTGS